MSTVDLPIHLTPARRRQIEAHADAVQAHLESIRVLIRFAPAALDAGDRQVAEELLPAWRATFNGLRVSVADLRAVDPDTALGAVVGRFLAQWPATEATTAAQRLGELLARIADSGQPVAGFVVSRSRKEANSQTWVCSPLTDPEDPVSG